MNKKALVIILCVVMLGAAGFMFYRAMSSTPGAVVPVAGTPPAPPGAQNILPHGATLDFTPIEQYNQDRNRFPYPHVSSGEVGVDSLRLSQ